MPLRLLQLEHRPQEEEAGCLAACAQMALARLGLQLSQGELNHLFELSSAGVPLSRLTRLKKFNVQVTIQQGDLVDLLQTVDQDLTPLVFVRTGQLSYWESDTQHVLLVSGYVGSDVFLNDPALPHAPQRVSADELMLAWDEFDNVYAVIAKS